MLHRGVLTGLPKGQNLRSMDLDDLLPKTPGDPLVQLTRQDLDPFSVDELTRRIAALEAEIARCRARITHSASHRATAEGLFKR